MLGRLKTQGALGLAALAALVLIGGCGSRSAEAPEPTAPPPASIDTTGASSAAGAASLDELRLELEEVASGLDKPLFVTHAGDGSGRLFIVEQTGRVKVLGAEGAVGTFLDVSAGISTGGERGLLGLAFAPNYAESGRFYVNYTDRDGNTVIARFTASDPASSEPALTGPDVVLRVTQPYPNHNGGCIAFAPDGTLWVGMGDGGAAGDPQDRAQDDSALLGKMLSLDVEASDAPKPVVVQKGLRNPWRFSFDRATDDLWIADVGQNAYEEVNVVSFAEARDLDFGWARWEANEPYPPGAKRSRDGFTFPVIDYGRDVGQSVTGGYVYRGTDQPSLVGTYLFGDFAAGWIGGATVSEDGRVAWRRLLTETGIVPSSFGEDENGEIYVCDHRGAVLRIVASE